MSSVTPIRSLSMGFLAFIGLFASPVHPSGSGLLAGQEDDPSPHSDARLISEVRTVLPGSSFTVGVHFTLDPNWHNYWQNAGDSGLPTTIEWDLPDGLAAGDIQWPYPSRIVLFPLVDYGYSDEVTLLVDLEASEQLATGSTVRLAAAVDWLICYEICLPAYAELGLELPVEAGEPELDTSVQELFAEARRRLPQRVDRWSGEAEVTGDGYRLTVRSSETVRAPPDSVYFFVSETEVLDHAAPQQPAMTEGSLEFRLRASPYASRPQEVLRGVLVAEGGGSWVPGESVPAIEIEAPVRGAEQGSGAVGAGGQSDDVAAPAVPETAVGEVSGAIVTFPIALLFAFIGGLLLNLMPCVFPVLSLKILSAASQGGENRRSVKAQGFAFGFGVVATFVLLAGLLAAMRAGGAQLGWGFQLQSPYFVAFMASLFFAIGLNLMGVFEVGASLTRLGGRLDRPSGFGESVASGVLATAIATPCTAPFMGAALGFALTRSTLETLLVFGVLGLGMALPYVVLSLAPGLLERIPRPGPWMETMKNILAFPMFATVIWLIWVFGQQTGMGGAANLLTALLLLSAAGWMVGKWHRTDLRSGRVARAVSVVLLILGAGFVARGTGGEPALSAAEGWQTFSQAAVDATLAQGQPVFVNFTAAWCLTCQVNERMVLSSDTVQEAFRERNVALFKADWTRQDPEITAALESFGRSGVPLYVLYSGKRTPPPLILPAILTEPIVLEALDQILSPAPTTP